MTRIAIRLGSKWVRSNITSHDLRTGIIIGGDFNSISINSPTPLSVEDEVYIERLLNDKLRGNK